MISIILLSAAIIYLSVGGMRLIKRIERLEKMLDSKLNNQ